jgi:hypothetical protein
MPATADDDDVILGLGLGISPGRPPSLVAREGFFENSEG